MTTFSNKFKNTIFGAFSPYFGEKMFFQKIYLLHTAPHGPPFQKKIMRLSQENFQTDRQTEGGVERQTERL